MNEPRGTSTVSKILKIPSAATATSADTIIVSRSSGRVASTRENKKIENAIYAHIRALRVLGRRQINTAEIADALGLDIDLVHRAIASLTKRGVKVL